MSTLTHERIRTQRQICWPAYREQREHLADLFPAIARNGGAKQPLAVGIKYDLIGANTGLTAADIKHFLRAYCFGPKYLRMLKPGARRYALDGLVDGVVTDDEAAFARLSLDAHFAMRQLLKRKAGGRAAASAQAEAAYVEAA